MSKDLKEYADWCITRALENLDDMRNRNIWNPEPCLPKAIEYLQAAKLLRDLM